MDKIISIVSERTGVPVSDILSAKRAQDINEARRIFIYLSYMSGCSMASISKYLHGMTRQNISRHVRILGWEMEHYRYIGVKVKGIKDAVV